MNDFILHTKSYAPDVEQCKRCIESIEKHNKENIPVYISVPRIDFQLFKDKLGTLNYELVADEDSFVVKHVDGWRGQQIVKTHINKLNICKNYLCLDSDSVFINDFYKSDFMADKDVVYTVMQEPMDIVLHNEVVKKAPNGYYKIDFFRTVRDIRRILGNEDFAKLYLFGHPPYAWNCDVWTKIQDFFAENNMDMEQFFMWFEQQTGAISRECVIYGEFLLKTQMINVYPTASWFKSVTSEAIYNFDCQIGVDTGFIKRHYLGIAIQDGRSTREKGITWNSEMSPKLIQQLKDDPNTYQRRF
tara:strand:+ start:2046 stop:2951 length:906 start_codon:yes stop_codon:yes gene_type:complete